MKVEWYYADKGNSIGPIFYEDVAHRIQNDKTQSHLVWSDGMPEWEDAKNIPAFADLFRSGPPPLPSSVDGRDASFVDMPPTLLSNGMPSSNEANEVQEQASNPNDVHPWRRYFARMLDNYIFVLMASFAIGILFPTLFDGSSTRQSEQMQGLLYLAAYVPIEGFCLYAFGTTFGKALYGISLSSRGSEITFYEALHRSALVWFRGLGIGIPLVTFFTLINARNKLKSNGATTWDSELGWSVKHSQIGAWRWVGIIACWIGITFVLFALIKLASP